MNIGNNKQIVVIGAGAAGMIAAARAAECGADVTMLEKGARPGRKLLIAGNGRCNITNSRELSDFLPMYGHSGNFIRNAFSQFFRDELLDLLKKYNVETVTEPDGRIFPESGISLSIVEALKRYLSDTKVDIQFNTNASEIDIKNGHVQGVNTGRGYYQASAVILASGGASYSKTGSNGDGFEIARKASHSIVKIRPALVPIIIKEKKLVARMQGVSLKNIRLTSYQCSINLIPELRITKQFGRGLSRGKPPDKILESRIGDIVFTDFGISGPAALLMSLSINNALEQGPVSVSIDIFPDLSHEQLHHKLQNIFDAHGQRSLRRILLDLLPNKVADPLIDIVRISPGIRASYITGEQRKKIVTWLKSLRFSVSGTLPVENALVTAGGISLKEIDPRTMMSKLVKGLFFCGEVMDIDADTGGYNLQSAFSTGYVAGKSAADFLNNE